MSRFMGNDGEDVVQEAYARALKYLPSFDHSRDFDKWFNKILSNTVKDFKKDRGGLVVDLDPDYLEAPEGHSEALYGRLIAIYGKGLRADHLEVVKLYFEKGYKPREINEVVDLSLTNIRTIISKFRLLMKGKEE